MLVLGIDPGTRIMGVGVLSVDDSVSSQNPVSVEVVNAGVIEAKKSWSLARRLAYIYRSLVAIIDEVKPDVAVMERAMWVGRSAATAIALGRAEAIAMLAAENAGVPSHFFSPTEIKKIVTGSGAASKSDVARAVKKLLGITQELSLDTTDGLASGLAYIRINYWNQDHLIMRPK